MTIYTKVINTGCYRRGLLAGDNYPGSRLQYAAPCGQELQTKFPAHVMHIQPTPLEGDSIIEIMKKEIQNIPQKIRRKTKEKKRRRR